MRLCIVVPSVDKYSDIWPLLFLSIRRHFVGNIPQIYLIGNSLHFEDPLVTLLKVGDDVSWSDNLIVALPRIEAEYILIWIDDLILTGSLDWNKIESRIDWFFQCNGDYLRLNPTPVGIDRNVSFSKIPAGDLYRSSTVFSIWRKAVLLSVLRRGESPWEFELKGSSRTDRFENWFASRDKLVRYTNLVIKGKVDPRALVELRNIGLTFNSNRPVLTSAELLIQRLRDMRFYTFRLFPRRWRRVVREWFL